MTLHTASEVIGLLRRLEEETAYFYDRLSGRGRDTETWLGFAKDNRKNVKDVERAYYNVISDALDGTFAFDIEDIGFDLNLGLPESAPYALAVGKASVAEKKIADLYSLATRQSQSLLPDVSRAMKAVGQKRQTRMEKIESLRAG
jgi:hypothetical protein